tara:strand:+ start:2041 stop:2340 length:300 start_codon:yes stop_codon:yes gene_type:complete
MPKPLQECPLCGKEVKSLTGHLKRQHLESTANMPGVHRPEHTAELKDADTAEVYKTLEVTAPPTAAAIYHCIGCGGSLTPNQTPCPACGEDMAWGTDED